jgi:hypothetical protein
MTRIEHHLSKAGHFRSLAEHHNHLASIAKFPETKAWSERGSREMMRRHDHHTSKARSHGWNGDTNHAAYATALNEGRKASQSAIEKG